MATAIQLTNLVGNGSFVSNVNSFSGFQTNNQNQQNTLALSYQANPLAPSHGEYAAGACQLGGKMQGLMYCNPTTNLGAIVGHKYYIRAQVRLRGTTAGQVSTFFHVTTQSWQNECNSAASSCGNFMLLL